MSLFSPRPAQTGRVVRYSLTAVCLFTLILQSVLIGRPAKAGPVRALPLAAAPVSAPPEPYVIGGVSNAFSTSWLLANAISASDSVLKGWNVVLGFIAPKVIVKSEKPKAPAPLAPTQPAATVDFDFDGDGKSDLSRWHPGTTEIKIKNSGGGSDSTYTIGASTATLAPADFDGDGKTDVAFFSAGTWTIRMSSTGSTTTVSGFGASGDIPVPGNYLGTTADNLAYWRPSNGTWYWREVGNSTVYSHQWGASGDIPTPGDYDGDGKMDLVVYRPSNYYWYVYKSSNGSDVEYNWGTVGDIPVPADFDGDGKTDITMYRPSSGTWFILKSSTGFTTSDANQWGYYADQPVAGDFDGDGKADYAVWRPTTGTWWILKSDGSGYFIESLGSLGDTAVESSYVKQIGGGVTPDSISQAQLSPKNATGGTNLYSQNFSWGTQLVGLPGRAGFDLGLGISYNSLIWTKVGSAMVFNDNPSRAAGFTLGYPKIEPVFYDDVSAKFVYTMVTPSGAREAFYQNTVSNVFETHDSSYMQLVTTGATNPNDPVEDITLAVTTTDGTKMDYQWIEGAYRCTKITDRNGNYITATYNGNSGELYSVTDTLGRTIVNDGDSITQTWKDTNGSGSNVTHTWATFSYTTKTLALDFDSSLTVVGPPSGTVLPVLDKITYADGSSTKFTYNDYGQVDKIANYSEETTPTLLNYVRTNLDSLSAHQPDCPRLSDTYNWVKNFNQDIYGTEQETHVANTISTGASVTLPGGLSGSGLIKVQVWLDGHPDNLRTNTYVSPSGWSEGLPVATEDCLTTSATVCTTRERWSYTAWTQENTSAAYEINPRVTETRVGDTSNVKKTTIDYLMQSGSSTVTQYGLMSAVKVYDSDLSTVLKTQTSSYDLDSAYTSRSIIGLPAETDLYEGTSTLMAKTTYAYDEGDFSDSGLVQSVTPVQHDGTNYGTSFVYRGNLTSTTHWDATAPTNGSLAITSSVKYNTAGSPVSQTTPWDGTNTRTIRIGYADSFSSSPGVTTNAYPTTITDPAGTSLGASGHSSTVIYRYDIGANVEADSPAPTGQTYGKTSKRIYDSIGRLDRNSIYINTTEHSYVRYEYPTNGVESLTYAPIVDADGDGNIAEDEVTTESWTDGAGRVRRARTEHPGSSGGYSGVLTEYDILGQVKRQSVPTEINSSWAAYGDDATRGFIWNSQEYDWKGRTTRTIPSDSTGSDGKDTLISYDGCGCAGGQVTTIQGASVPRTDTTGNARRTQKIYDDILGRQYKTETYKWDGTTLYNTNELTFNGRDQVLTSKLTDDTDTNSPQAHQDATATYDGFGRLSTKHVPQQNSGTTTSYNYNPDNSISDVTDARGAVTSFTYNDLGLPAGASWSVPGGSPIAVPTSTTYSYDNLGNRTAMTDGTGSTSYSYDSLSEMTSETKSFTDLTSSSFAIGYEYTLAGRLKKITDPAGVEVNYTEDKVGRLTGVTGSGTLLSSTSTYASSFAYRAWGGTKSFDYGDSTSTAVDYNSKLQISSFAITGAKPNSSSSSQAEGGTYEYYNDGMLKFATDTRSDTFGGTFDKAFTYDHIGRVVKAYSAIQAQDLANGTNHSPYSNPPFQHDNTYDAFSNPVSSMGLIWSADATTGGTYDSHNRNTAWTYDADGRMVSGNDPAPDANPWVPLTYSYEASGQLSSETQTTSWVSPLSSHPVITTTSTKGFTYDGDGMLGKLADSVSANSRYYLRSSVTGNVIVEYDNTGTKQVASVYAGKDVLAQEIKGDTTRVLWQHTNPVVEDGINTDSTGIVANRATVDPQGGLNVGDSDPFSGPVPGPDEIPGSNPNQVAMNRMAALLYPGSGGPGCVDEYGAQLSLSACTTGISVGAEAPRSNPEAIGIFGVWRDSDGPGNDDTHINTSTTFVALFDGQQRRPFDIPGIVKGVQKVWDTPGCKDLIEKLLNGVSNKKNPLLASGNIPDLVNQLLTQKNGGLTREITPGSNGFGSGSGNLTKGNALLYAGAVNNNVPHNQLVSDIQTVVAELTHLSGSKNIYTDEDFADVVHADPELAQSNGRGGAQSTPLPYPLDQPGLTKAAKRDLLDSPGYRDWSAYWHNVVGNLCLDKVDWKNIEK